MPARDKTNTYYHEVSATATGGIFMAAETEFGVPILENLVTDVKSSRTEVRLQIPQKLPY